MAPSIEEGFSVERAITFRSAKPSDAEPVAKLQYEVYRIAYAHILPHSYLHSSDLYSELLAKRQRYYENKETPQAVFLVGSNEIDHGSDTLSSVGALCEAGPLRAYPGLKGIEDFGPSDTLELWTNYVHRSFQGRGVGQRLFVATVKAAIKQFPQISGRMIVLTFERNHGGRRFYEKMGGKLFCLIPNYPIEGQEYLVACYLWEDMPEWVRRWESGVKI